MKRINEFGQGGDEDGDGVGVVVAGEKKEVGEGEKEVGEKKEGVAGIGKIEGKGKAGKGKASGASVGEGGGVMKRK